jgi:subtilisin family serine protease
MNKGSRILLSVVLATSIAVFGSPSANSADPALAGAVNPVQAMPEKSPHGVYIVVMASDPVAALASGAVSLGASKLANVQKPDMRSAAALEHASMLAREHDNALTSVGATKNDKLHEYKFALNGFAARLSFDQAVQLSRDPSVLRVIPDRMRYPTTDNSPQFLELDVPGGPYASGYDGEGVVVGIIDSGIWPEHPSFADDGSYPAPPTGPLPCDFGNVAHNPSDVPFTCNDKLIGARDMLTTYRALIGADADEFDSARDDDGHGTHVASTAIGNAGVAASIFGIPRGTVAGIAPRAHVVAYKGLGKLGGFTSDLTAAIDQAVFDGVDVINYSVGGGPSLGGSDDIAFLFAADAGVHVATSAGNSGPGPATIGGPASVPWLTTVGASNQDRTFRGSAASSDGWEFFGESITPSTAGEVGLVDGEDVGGELCLPGTLNAAQVAGKIVLCQRGAVARVSKSQEVFNAGGVGMILYNNFDAQFRSTDNHWVPTVHINNTDGQLIKGYIDGAGAAAVARINGGVRVETDAPNMASFSSRGPDPVALDIIKPDVTAPGQNILAGASPIHFGDQVQGQLFQAIDGTSMSSPHVAGVYALLKQARPDWSPATMKSALMTTAYQDVNKEDGVTPADPFDMGAGHIRPGGRSLRGSVFEPGLAYEAGLNEYLGFLCDADPSVFADPAATCAFLDSLGIPIIATDLNLASIGVSELPGSITVMRTVTSVAQEDRRRRYNVTVESPPGYDVTVSPSSIRLRKGETAEFAVTIVNRGAPVGEWRFGSLTWKNGANRYTVRSPIAVRSTVAICDVDDDSDVDLDDIRMISQMRGETVPPANPAADFDGDGVITTNDARYCTYQCTQADCATP